MRSRALVLVALVSVPAVSMGQGIRLPRTGGTPGTRPANLPPEIPAVARALEFKRSRWSGEGYAMFSAIEVPAASGSTSYTSYGAGSRVDYRFADHFSATMDVTASVLGSFGSSQTGEVGTRYVPDPRAQTFRPYFDLRAAYLHANDRYDLPNTGDQVPGAIPPSEFSQGRGRYTGGLGAVGGVGFEYSVTHSLAFTNEITAMRTHMNSRVLTNSPANTTYWMTSYRYTLGLKYNPVEALRLVQKATQ